MSKRKLTAEQAEAKFENYKVQNVFHKIKELEFVCKKVELKIPLNAVINASEDPYFGVSILPPKKENIFEVQEPIKTSALAAPESALPSKRKTIELKTPDGAHFFKYLELTFNNILTWWSLEILFISVILKLWS